MKSGSGKYKSRLLIKTKAFLVILSLFYSHLLQAQIPSDPLLDYISEASGLPATFSWPEVKTGEQERAKESLAEELATLPDFRFVDEINTDDQEKAYFSIAPGDLHLIDINHDGCQDVLYQAYLGMNRGYEGKLLFCKDDDWFKPWVFEGQLVSLGENGLLIHKTPCCDGFVESYSYYHVDGFNIEHQISYVFFQSNLERLPNIDAIGEKTGLKEVPSGAALYYFAKRPIYKQGEQPAITDIDVGMYPFAHLKSEATVNVFDQEKTIAGARFILVSVDAQLIGSFHEIKRAAHDAGGEKTVVFGWLLLPGKPAE